VKTDERSNGFGVLIAELSPPWRGLFALFADHTEAAQTVRRQRTASACYSFFSFHIRSALSETISSWGVSLYWGGLDRSMSLALAITLLMTLVALSTFRVPSIQRANAS
jgi:hypothetical protein